MQAFIKALTWTFIHSLWQGLLAALVVAIIISVTRKTSAKVRYNLLWMVLIVFLCGSLLTFLVQWNQQQVFLQLDSIKSDGSIISTSETLSTGFMADLVHWLNSNSGFLMLAWMIFFLLKCIMLFAGLASVNRLRHYKTFPVEAEWKSRFDELCTRLNLRKPVGLLQSGLVKVPVALGIIKPVILLPLGLITQLPPEQVESILLHELSHIRRKDYLINLLQHFAEAIFFFNPAIIWISWLIRQEREACCDDLVIENSSEKLNYLNALVAFQEYSISRQGYAMAISSRKHYLFDRIKRMITKENKSLNLLEKLALFSGLFVFSAFTYIHQQEEIVGLGSKTLLILREQPTVIIPTENKDQVETEMKRVEANGMIRGPLKDTLPPKKKKLRSALKLGAPKSPPLEKKNEAAEPGEKEVLKEIIKMKEQIGEKKEIIGLKKAQLKEQEGKDKIKEKEIEKEIEEEREELESKRNELQKKRELYQNLKKIKVTGNFDPKPAIDKNLAAKLKNVPVKQVHFDPAKNIKLANASVSTKDRKLEFHDVKDGKQELQYKMDNRIEYNPSTIDLKPRTLKARDAIKSSPRKTIKL